MAYTAPVPGFGKLKNEAPRDFMAGDDAGGDVQADMGPQNQPRKFGARGDKAGRIKGKGGKGRGWHGSPRFPVARSSKRK